MRQVCCSFGFWLLALALVGSSALSAAEFQVEKKDDRVVVKIDGQPFTEYLVNSGSKPILWPIIGPTGKPITRSFPMEKVAGEERDRDHVWHRSLWFTHGDVNGVDFWAEGKNKGTIKHHEFKTTEGGKQATIVTENRWIGPDGVKQCEDQRTITMGVDGKNRWIDFEIELRAPDGPVVFGDTKEGSFGVRVPTTMRVEAKQGGQIINSVKQQDDDAWGQPAAWVDYHGPLPSGEIVGISIFNHPSSYGFPTPWHVRAYGLFAANPFGRKDFPPGGVGGFTLKKGETIKLRYRVVLHEGDATEAHVADAYATYAKENAPPGDGEKK